MVPGRQGEGVRPARPRGQALRRRPAAASGGDGGGVAGGRLLAPLAGRVCRWDSWYALALPCFEFQLPHQLSVSSICCQLRSALLNRDLITLTRSLVLLASAGLVVASFCYLQFFPPPSGEQGTRHPVHVQLLHERQSSLHLFISSIVQRSRTHYITRNVTPPYLFTYLYKHTQAWEAELTQLET